MKNVITILVYLASLQLVFGQGDTVLLETSTGTIEGTLLLPAVQKKIPVALIIAGSGPTDRDGNNPITGKNNSLKMLAEGLAENGIASLRYDKRGIAASQAAGLSEMELRFDNYVEDAKGWVEMLSKDDRFNSVIIVGHSEGSLIGMIAAQNSNVSKYISLAGAGQPADLVLRDQLKAQQAIVLEKSAPILDELVKGNEVDSIPPWLNSLFRPSVQPYLISWFKYDPQKEIAKLKIPVLILQGSTDIQVGVEEANLLSKANSKAKLVIIDGMNHILKNAEADRTKNIQTYSLPDLPLNNELVQSIITFIK